MSWIAVGVTATSAGILVGIAADKMFFESYGIGGWLQWGALLAAGIVASIFGANAIISGRTCRPSSICSGRAARANGWQHRCACSGCRWSQPR